ncbi:MAG: sugar transferase [Firmicutes bacterium]|nr:sugar transferase [Bacillota bacterium]MCL5289992.1 sugar transferase [Bacillota bacterium]
MNCLVNVVGAIVLLVVLAPLMVLVALAVRLDSSGPAIFKQTRVGQFDRYFTLYKFRTMHVGTPDLPSEVVSKDDYRFTRLGKLLRRFSIDELPQLFNIIRGDMNFIGPRPALYNQYDLIAMRKKTGVNRLKPGVTGWAQVNGRENISLERKVELDKYYSENCSWWLDLMIIWLTIVRSLRGVNLYKEKSGQIETITEQPKNFPSSL